MHERADNTLLDAVYIDAERRFKEIETETKRLHEDAKKYSEAVNGMNRATSTARP